MAPSRLLRYIFRHGPKSPQKPSFPPQPPAPAPPARSASPAPYVDEGKTALDAVRTATSPRTPDRLIVPVIETIVEESLSSAGTSLASLELDVHSFTARELLYAAIEEARTAMHAHLDTIQTALLLFDALDGFSQTITSLRQEMESKKTVCEEKIGMLDDVENAVKQMDRDVEDSDDNATLHGR